MFMKNFTLLWLLVFSALGAGCATEKIPVEDPAIFTEYAQAISVLKDPYLPSNSKEKYEAAVFLDEHVDFSYARNVSTLDKIFAVRDLNMDPEGDKFVFSYLYRGNNIQFRFVRNGDTIVYSAVVKRN